MAGAASPGNEYTRLLLRAQRGDAAAFAQLYTALAPAVRGFAASLDGQLSAHDREDLLQEVFLQTWQSLANYRGEASAGTFILAITRKVVLKHLERGSRRRPRALGDPEHPCQNNALVEQLARQEAVQAVRQALSQLTDAQRQAVDLLLIRELPRAEAVKQAQCNASQFAKRLERAVRSLGRLLGNSPKCISL